jgi:glycosidase
MHARRPLLAAATLALALTGCRSAPVAPPPAAVQSTAAAGPATATAPATRWWDDRVFYEVFVRSFADSTSGPLANDGIGDLQGLIERLDYLNDGDPATQSDLGITGIWLMPISPSPSYHGYDVTDYLDVNPQFGTLDDFRRLLAECHRRGIKVITDLVLNHSSSRHPWFKAAITGDPRYRDWYVFVPADSVPDVRGPWDQQVWHELRRQHYFGIFWSGMPDLNYRNAAVSAEARRIADFWLEEVGVDGFRLDAIRHLIEDGDVMSDTPQTLEWLRGFRVHVKSRRPEALLLGEVWTRTETVSEYISTGALDLAFEFDLAAAILESIKAGRRDTLAYSLANVVGSYPDGQFATMVTNHDQNRIASELGEDPRRLKLAATLLLAAPGVPFLYYGEEIGQIGRKPDEMIRNPMPWTAARHGGFTQGAEPWEPLQPGHERRNVATQDADPGSLLHHYRRWIGLRNAEPALRTGDFVLLDAGRDDVIAWQRRSGGRTLTLVANLSGADVDGVRLPAAVAGDLATDRISGEPLGLPAAGLALGPWEARLFASAR